MKKDLKLYTDIDGNGNWLKNIKVAKPTVLTDPANKDYVDISVTYDTEKAKKYDTPFVKTGGLDITFNTKNKLFKELFDEMYFPLIKPVYNEGSLKILNEPIKCIIGAKSKFTCFTDILLGDRKHTVGNISCIQKAPDGTTSILYTNPTAILQNIKCIFEPKPIDPESLTELLLSIVLSDADVKYDSYGQPSPDIIFQSNYTISKTIKYKGILPLFYGFYNTTDALDLDINSVLNWDIISSKMNVIDNVDMYKEGFGTKEVIFKLQNLIPQRIILLIPNICKGVFINDDNILECCSLKMHKLALPNAREGFLQKYTAVLFQTGNVAYDNPKNLRIVWEDNNELQTSGITQKITDANGHIIIDDNYIEFANQRKLHITNARVENKLDEDVTTVHVHPENAAVDGGFYDE